jgi:adenosylhomocysteine nucleosidase
MTPWGALLTGFGPTNMSVEIAIIAALEREVRPLVRRWSRRELVHGGLALSAFERDGVLVVCSGIGGEFARRAAVAVFASEHPQVVISAGLAGALDRGLRIGQVFQPATVVDLRTCARFEALGRSGVLVSTSSVLDRDAKRRIQGSYGAQAADMEAASVALVAAQHGCPFVALKAVSDSASFDMPPFDRYIDTLGRIRTVRFLAGWAIWPQRWAAVARLWRNSARASQELSGALAHLIEKQGAALEPALSGRTR